eukprot:GAFH01000902.1.p1 GENE.GAFH01000902.1~~GAFH01000902.1.p1  ORF type:complete len:520 (-),score=113.61 GAFH01000902.1:245-1804(-)
MGPPCTAPCSWVFTSPSSTYIRITVIKYGVYRNSDSIEAFDGWNRYSTSLFSLYPGSGDLPANATFSATSEAVRVDLHYSTQPLAINPAAPFSGIVAEVVALPVPRILVDINPAGYRSGLPPMVLGSVVPLRVSFPDCSLNPGQSDPLICQDPLGRLDVLTYDVNNYTNELTWGNMGQLFVPLDPAPSYPVFDLAVSLRSSYLNARSTYRLAARWLMSSTASPRGFSVPFTLAEDMPASSALVCNAQATLGIPQGFVSAPKHCDTSMWTIHVDAEREEPAPTGAPQVLWISFPSPHLDYGDELRIYDGTTIDPNNLIRLEKGSGSSSTQVDSMITHGRAVTMQYKWGEDHYSQSANWQLAVNWLQMASPAIVVANDPPASVMAGDTVYLSWNTTLLQPARYVQTKLYLVPQNVSDPTITYLDSTMGDGPIRCTIPSVSGNFRLMVVTAFADNFPPIYATSAAVMHVASQPYSPVPFILLGSAVLTWLAAVSMGFPWRLLSRRRRAVATLTERAALLASA